MLFRKLFRTMGLYKAQFISMIIMIALGIGIFVGFNMEWVSIDKNANGFLEETGFADFRIISEAGFQKEDADSIVALCSLIVNHIIVYDFCGYTTEVIHPSDPLKLIRRF